MLNSLNNENTFNGQLYGKMNYKAGRQNREKILGPAWICYFGDKSFISRINQLAKTDKNSLKVKQSNSMFEKSLIFQLSPEDYKKTNSVWSKFSFLLKLNEKQKKILDNKNVTSFVFELPKSDYIWVQEYGKSINIINNMRIKKFKKNIRSFFSKPEEQKWLDDFFRADKKK